MLAAVSVIRYAKIADELNRYRGLVVDRSACILFSIPQSFHILRI